MSHVEARAYRDIYNKQQITKHFKKQAKILSFLSFLALAATEQSQVHNSSQGSDKVDDGGTVVTDGCAATRLCYYGTVEEILKRLLFCNIFVVSLN